MAVRSDDDERQPGPVKRARPPEINPEDSRAYTWFALRVQPQRELHVERVLADLGFAVFVAVSKRWEFPNRQTRARWEKREVIRPIMPGWVFVGMASFTPGWERIVWIPLVTGVASWGGQPMVIPHDRRPIKNSAGDVVGHRTGLRDLIHQQAGGRFNAPDYQRWQDTRATFKAGDTVLTQMTDEVGEAIRGKVIEITDRRCKLLLDKGLFGAVREIEADITKLRAVE